MDAKWLAGTVLGLGRTIVNLDSRMERIAIKTLTVLDGILMAKLKIAGASWLNC